MDRVINQSQEVERMTALEELTRRAQYVAVSIREYIAGEWDGNVDAMGAMAEHLEQGIDRASKEIALNNSIEKGE